MKQINFADEIIVDCFAGGGGWSTGIEQATGSPVDIAVNHDHDAILMHKTNHPYTEHYQEDVFMINPQVVTRGRPVGWAHFSPDCKHFSKAKGKKPVDKTIRGLAWVALRWAGTVRPRIISLENVTEFQTWGPLDRRRHPMKSKKGETFKKFIKQLRDLEYDVDWRVLTACDYGAPTTRTRFFLIARCDGRPIVWPEKTHGPGLIPYRAAAEIIDWSIPCPSIFDRKKPLVENTLNRIARGLQKFVIDDPKPFIMQAFGGGYEGAGRSVEEPLPTITAKDHNYLVSPYIVPIGYGERDGQKPRVNSVNDPLGTVVSTVKHYLCTPYIAQYHSYDNSARGQTVKESLATIDTSNRYAVIAPYMMHLYGTSTGRSVKDPIGTVTATGQHIAQVQAFLIKYYGQGTGQSLNEPLDTIVSKDRFGIVMIYGEPYQIIDIGMRMLTPRELYNAQGFPPDYIIDYDYTGKAYPKTAQVARCGNAVPPPFATALVRANWPERCEGKNIQTMKQFRESVTA
jgi:DNA (cytosine-5)-methyltransferase 1